MTERIEAVFLETHNWGRAARFFQALGFDLEFSTAHSSGQLRNGNGPDVFIAEVPASVLWSSSVSLPYLVSRSLRRILAAIT